MSDKESQNPRASDLIGYANLSHFVASDKEHSGALFRRFEALSARNVFYLQSELRALELKQEDFDRTDAEIANSASTDLYDTDIATDYQVLEEKAVCNEQKARDRLELIKRIRSTLEEYEGALLRHAALNKLERPSRQVFEAFNSHFHNGHLPKGQQYPRLDGLSADLYDRDFSLDIVSLGSGSEAEDRLTGFLRNRFPRAFTRKKNEISRSTRSLSEYRLQLFVGLLNVLLAASFLFGSIFNLFYVKSAEKRLGLISGYTVAFALSVSVTTSARKSEVFAACAAYAAVLVVFVSGNL